ncbi:MAG: 50S ribosomal protein L25/general stress protein Ctc [Dongiaceae bacterium]
MTEVHSLSVELRDRAGKGAARATRRAGRVPGVVYGNKEPATLISLEPRALVRELHKTGFFATLFDLKLGERSERVLPRDVQFDPVTDRPLHVDFLRVGADTRVHVNVPVIFQNELASPGLKRGGVLNIVRHEIEFVCAADSIPHSITIDLTGLDIGDGVHISMVQLPANVVPAITDRDFTIATIAPPTAQKLEAADAAAAAAAGTGAEAAAATPAAGAEKGEKKG